VTSVGILFKVYSQENPEGKFPYILNPLNIRMYNQSGYQELCLWLASGQKTAPTELCFNTKYML
jgi:hypothetical protein